MTRTGKRLVFIFMLALLGGITFAAVKFNAPQIAIDSLSPKFSYARIAGSRLGNVRGEVQTAGFTFGTPVFIRIFKKSRELELWLKEDGTYKLFKTYEICNYSGHLGPKLKEGDRQSPEGFYFVKRSALNPNSRYHLSFNIGFPNAFDRAHGRTGSYLMVHGNCVSIGCYAMTNAGIEEIYLIAEAALKAGQPFFRVHIFPFRMTEHNLRNEAGSPWIGFWNNLKEGHDLFEAAKVPPDVSVKGKRYVFSPGKT